MFNSPILDVVIGLVFVFLLYSLLATSIKEGIATIFSLRASMLKKGITKGMLSDTPSQLKLVSLFAVIVQFFLAALKVAGLVPRKKEAKKKLGDKFYDHPIIKNYGSSGIFPLPSYIPANNFSAVLIDVLKDDFATRLNEIAENKKQVTQSPENISAISKSLQNADDISKIKELLEYYTALYQKQNTSPAVFIDRETCKILLMHLKSSGYEITEFSKKLEDWFNDSMDRVSGWYKRQAQLILFVIGLFIAILFNVDTIQIAGKLSTDKDARDKIVQLAIKEADQYKDDPRVAKAVEVDPKKADSLMEVYQKNLTAAKKTLDSSITNANELLAIGWDGYGRCDSMFLHTLWHKTWVGFFYVVKAEDIVASIAKRADSTQLLQKTDSLLQKKDTVNRLEDVAKKQLPIAAAFYKQQYEQYPVHVKTAYVWYVITKQKKKLLGFLITAFAICLGAPFWFDLMNKLIKLRAAGKKEDSGIRAALPSADRQPVTINVNTQKTGEEAVG